MCIFVTYFVSAAKNCAALFSNLYVFGVWLLPLRINATAVFFTHLNFESDLITRWRAFERARHLFARDLALIAAAIEVFAIDSVRGVKRGDAPRTDGKLLLI